LNVGDELDLHQFAGVGVDRQVFHKLATQDAFGLADGDLDRAIASR
jgi:hypothetical protein